ncbi:hypothetical protein [Pseudomonas sp. CGJS7]|uniref:hypothetical protein n=1 Tax=Pseudomonas sp. CGJS7 TaxID=3109348 RepID=UPI003008390B
MKPLPAVSMLSCILALTACAHAAPGEASPTPAPAESNDSERVQAGGSVTLQPGGSVTLHDRSRLRFVGVTSDSRCKPNVQCIWAGEAALEFQWTRADGVQTAFSLTTPAEPLKSAGNWSFELQSLDFAEPVNAQVRISAK